MKKKLKRFFKTKSNWISLITLVLATAGLIISFFVEQYTYQIIGAMFLLIVVECFFLRIGYMEDIKNRLDSQEQQIPLKSRHECNKSSFEVFNQAKKEIFVSGITLHSLNGYASLFKQRKDIKIRLLALDTENSLMLEAFNHMRNKVKDREIKPSTENLNYFLGPHIEIRVIDSITPIKFVAIDMDSHDGYIKAEHILNGLDSINHPCLEITRSNSSRWFEIYKKQVETLWERGRNWEEVKKERNNNGKTEDVK